MTRTRLDSLAYWMTVIPATLGLLYAIAAISPLPVGMDFVVGGIALAYGAGRLEVVRKLLALPQMVVAVLLYCVFLFPVSMARQRKAASFFLATIAVLASTYSFHRVATSASVFRRSDRLIGQLARHVNRSIPRPIRSLVEPVELVLVEREAELRYPGILSLTRALGILEGGGSGAALLERSKAMSTPEYLTVSSRADLKKLRFDGAAAAEMSTGAGLCLRLLVARILLADSRQGSDISAIDRAQDLLADIDSRLGVDWIGDDEFAGRDDSPGAEDFWRSDWRREFTEALHGTRNQIRSFVVFGIAEGRLTLQNNEGLLKDVFPDVSWNATLGSSRPLLSSLAESAREGFDLVSSSPHVSSFAKLRAANNRADFELRLISAIALAARHSDDSSRSLEFDAMLKNGEDRLKSALTSLEHECAACGLAVPFAHLTRAQIYSRLAHSEAMRRANGGVESVGGDVLDPLVSALWNVSQCVATAVDAGLPLKRILEADCHVLGLCWLVHPNARARTLTATAAQPKKLDADDPDTGAERTSSEFIQLFGTILNRQIVNIAGAFECEVCQ